MGPPPSKIRLVLSEAARKFPPSLGGEYHLGQGLTNEKNFWVHRCGHSAIWWNDQGWFWCIGVHEKLGGNLAGIVGPCDNINWPISITKGWRYYNGKTWASAKTEDVKFLDCSSTEGMYFSMTKSILRNQLIINIFHFRTHNTLYIVLATKW